MGGLAAVIIQNMPGIIDLIKSFHQQQNPGAPPLTEEEIHQALLQAVTSTIAKDDLWLSSRPVADVRGADDN